MNDLTTTVIVAVVSVGAFWELVKFIFEKVLGLFSNKQREQINRIEAAVETIQDDLEENSKLTVAFSRERINYLCEKYTALGYIPKKEYVSFKMLGEAYTKNNNSEVQIKFDWVLKNLKVK